MTTARKPGTLRRLGLGAAMIAVAAAPLTMAAVPASATTPLQGCALNPLDPVFAGRNAAGVKQVRHNFVATCVGNRSIEVQQMFFEDDVAPDPDDFTGTVISTVNFPNPAITTRGVTVVLPNTDPGVERIYQRTRFRVSVNGGPLSAWTLFESSGVLQIAN